MADTVRLVVDGRNGTDAARHAGIRVVDFGGTDANTALVLSRTAETRDGQHGARATRAIPGAPAGFIAVELFESDIHAAGMHVVVVDHQSIQRPPTETEVPTQQDLFLSAAGGNGEDGHVGGNGEPGMDGTKGAPATRESDATPGTNGGRGGDAGEGTNGGDGGDGGSVQVYVDEENIHLLLAVQWNVQGGQGGQPGRHGQPGKGGKGGPGGDGHKWTETVGYRYHCTENCIGAGTASAPRSTSTALSRVQGTVGSSTRALMASVGAQAVEGGNLQAMIAQVAARYGAMRNPVISAGTCRCSGGAGHCIGCEPTEIRRQFVRHKGLDGRDGAPGSLITTPLIPGGPGQRGLASIVVRSRDGILTEYASKFKLELLDFEVEDENGDGIFEPGEHVIIRRIRIRNAGGMPSPTCRIPITALSSTWFQAVAGEGGCTYIPSSVPAGISVTLEGSLKVLIRQCDEPPLPGTTFVKSDTLKVQATMPWLNRKLEYFDASQVVTIQYPVQLQNINHLPTLAQGSRSNITWETFNKSVLALGGGATSLRPIEIDVSIASRYGALLSPSQEWGGSVVNQVDLLPASSPVRTKQMVRIAADAPTYQDAILSLKLYIAVPMSESSVDDQTPVEIQLIQQFELPIQVSPHYSYDPEADYLLITNPSTRDHQVQTIRAFIRDNLNMKMDEWNVGLYGGLAYAAEEGQVRNETVLATYATKTIILMGNPFQFFDFGTRTIPQLCDPRAIAELCLQGTSFLFLGSLNDPSYGKLLQNILLPVPEPISSVGEQVGASRSFTKKRDFTKSICQQLLVAHPAFAAYKLPVRTRWYRLGGSSSRGESKAVARYLRRQLPQERFTVSAVKSEAVAAGGVFEEASGSDESRLPSSRAIRAFKSLVILRGNPHQVSLHATEPHAPDEILNLVANPQTNRVTDRAVPPSTTAHLHPYESFICVACLPAKKRIEIAWEDHTRNGTEGIGYSRFALQAVILSLDIDINGEIRRAISRAGWPSNVPLAREKLDPTSFLRLHLPTLHLLLCDPRALTRDAPPDPILGILQTVQASCLPQTKRQIAQVSLIPLCQRQARLRKLVLGAIGALLAHKLIRQDRLERYRREARTLHSRIRSERRDVGRVLVASGREFTLKSEHEFREGWKRASELVPETVHCTGGEWDARWVASRDAMARADGEMEGARRRLSHMILEA